MDVDFITSEVLVEESLEVDENPDNSVLDGERCGICMDIIIDRGVLDCCQHWFCFGCIDDWATITNLCPLCQNEFQSITCVPVYDTISNNKVDEDSFSGNDDWSIEGNSSTLSFPSYYIDENAVTCLDGVGCKVRSGSSTIDNDCNLDTSIACDSCDIWYHAACVGFDPEGSSEDTWLCPRCSVSDETSVQRPNNQCGAESSPGSYLNEACFSGKVSVSVADAGETAIVVSMVKAEEPREKFYLAPEPNNDPKVDGVNSDSNGLTAEATKRTDLCHNMEPKELALSVSSDAFSNQECHPSALSRLNTEETANKASSFGRVENSLGNLSGGESGVYLHLGLSVGDSLIGENTLSDANEEAIRITCTKRKHAECSDNSFKTVDSEEANSENEGEALKKKIRGREKVQITTLKDQTSAVPCDDSQKCPTPVAVTKVINCNQSLKKEDVVSDVMSIVRGTGRRTSVGHEGGRNQKSAKETENKAGLRVKKIMRRATDDKESSVVVQKLRKEIRDAVRNKSDVGEHLFDPKLLTAFRTAIAGSATEPVKKLPPAALKMKKTLLQKGKVRENLTKKIYGDSNGRRRRAWDRDCEVEFWKHRCMRATKPEKIATLSSVLNLLRKHPEGPEKEEASGCQERNPILSRLYLADTSVFPRKGNIKPLSALTATDNAEQNGALLGSTGESQKSSSDQALKFTEGNKAPTKLGVHSVDDKGLKDKIPSLKANNLSSKAHPNRGLKGSVVAPLAGSKLNLPKETGTKRDDKKMDKRKWALEVLARKKAVGVNSAEHEKQEDNAMLKGSFPLLAQLPGDMRPELAPSRHNKIPLSVRQKQLYRLTEHFLRKLNLPEMRRTAATELAVADAINIEKEVADRSNSKQGYLNLCSHEILRRSDGCKPPVAQEPSSEAQSTIPVVSEQAGDELPTDPDVIDALRIAGLLFDTPPNSPCVVPAEADETKMQMEEGPNNMFEIDSNEEVDIYGDFEYDLEDEDYIGATAMKVSKQPAKGESKMKVLLTTLKSEGLNGNENSEWSQSFEDLEKHADSAFFQKSHIGAEIRGSAEVGTDKSSVPLETLPGEEGEEPSLAECEELYGPDKEPLASKLPPCCQDDPEVPTENNTHEENQNLVSSQAECKVTVFVSHDSSDGDNTIHDSQAIEKIAGNDKSHDDISKPTDSNSVPKKVEAYIKEHIRPLCKSGIISAEQYRWAVAKTTDKVMKYHSNAKNANFLIKEGEKVKKLAEQYVEQAQQKGEK